MSGGPCSTSAGTGRVSLELASRGSAVVALDADASLLEALEQRASGLPVESVVADAHEFAITPRFRSCWFRCRRCSCSEDRRTRGVPRRAPDPLAPGGLLVAALADAMDCFDDEHERRRRPTPARSTA